jgi:hypothetical protein
MKKITFCLIPAMLLSSQAALADGPRWRVTETSGDVQVMRAGLSRTASRGSMLYSGDVIVTGNRGRAVVTRGEEYMIVSPSTRLQLPGDTRMGGITQIIEEVGNVIYNVQRRNHEHFGVETPYLAAVVKGTTFSVTVGPEGSSVQVLEGLVEVSTLDGGASRLVEPGSVALVAASNRYQLTVEGSETEVIDSPNVPEESEEASPEQVTEGPSSRVTVAFTAPSAGRYGNEISNEIRATPVSIGTLTGGFMGGQTEVGAQFAAIEANNGSSELRNRGADGNNGHGNDEGGFDSSNPGNSNGSNAGGNGNGNAGGNGNSGPGNNNAGGNGNGNAGGNGDGNAGGINVNVGVGTGGANANVNANVGGNGGSVSSGVGVAGLGSLLNRN